MVLNRSEQRLIEGLFQPISLDKAKLFDGKYGTKPSKEWENTFHQHHWVANTMRSNRTIDTSTYRIGTSVPNWRIKLANHEDAGSAFAATLISIRQRHAASYELELVDGNHATQTKAYGWWDPVAYLGQSYYNYIPLYDTSVDVALDNKAIAKLYKKIDDHVGGAAFLGELRETVALFKSPLKSLNKAIDVQIKHSKRLREKVVRRAKRDFELREKYKSQVRIKPELKIKRSKYVLREWREAAASSFLEWQWGVRPLMNDIDELFSSLTQALQQREVINCGASASQYYNAQPISTSVTAYSVTANVSVQSTCHTSVSYKGAFMSRIDSSADLSETLGVAPMDWVPAAYEVMPLSWLLDYFGNLGQLINCYVSAQRAEKIFLSKTVRHSLVGRVTITPLKPGLPGFNPAYIKSWNSNPGTMVVKKKHVSRNPQTSMPLPQLRLHGELLSPMKVANLTAYKALAGDATTFRNRARL